MEGHVISHARDHLISSLNFKAGNSAAYVQAARLVRFLPESGDTWTTANRTIRFRLASADFLDLESVRLELE